MEEEEDEIEGGGEPAPEIPEPGVPDPWLEEHERLHALFAVAGAPIAPIDAPVPAEVLGNGIDFRNAFVEALQAQNNPIRWDQIDEAQQQEEELEAEELEEERRVEANLEDRPLANFFDRMRVAGYRQGAVQRIQFNHVAPIPAPAADNPLQEALDRARARAQEILNAREPARNLFHPLNEEPRAVGNDMNYDQLVRRYPALADRYVPDLSNRNNAARALQQFDQDPVGTPEEREALRLYLNGHVQVSNVNYRWCAECDMMVGFENHTHCPFCTYAMVQRGEGEVRGSHHQAGCANCGECCRVKGHRHCPTCDSHMERGCRHCTQCTNCCKCVLCTQAGCQYMQECEDCKKCYDHCTCTAVETADPSGKTFPAIKLSERKLFDCTRFSGIEWEYNRAGDQRAMDYWTRKWRGHLHRDDSCGYEAVTAPVAGDYMVRCVTSMGKVLARATIDNRCSIHTHVDAADLQWTDMFRFLELYARIEPILYMIAGQERLDNRYAVPIGKEYATALKRVDRKDAIMAVAFCPLERDGRKHAVTTMPDHGRNSQREKPGRRADNHQYCRRKGLNILPWLAGRGPRPQTPVSVPVKAGDTLEKLSFRHGVSVAALMRWNKIKPGGKLGKNIVINKRTLAPDTTVEFRIHPNTNDPIRVINWVKVVTRLVEWSVKHTDKDLENLPKSALRIMCQHVVPECAPWIMTRVKEWRKETARNSGRQARRITLKGGRYEY